MIQKKSMMQAKYITRIFFIALLFLSFVVVPTACSSEDDGVETTPVPNPDQEPEPDPVGDATNTNTSIEAKAPEGSEDTLTSTITVQLATSDGALLTTGGATVVLTTTGAATISAVTDNGDGTYTASISSTINETVTVSGTLEGVAITDTVVINFIRNDESNPAQEIVQATDPVGPSILRINSGGPEVTYGDVTFQADQYFEGPTEAYTNPFVTEIAETDMDELFLSERVTDNNNPTSPFSYNIPLTNGTYTVKLYFAEIFWGIENPEMREGGTGSRLFNISMEATEIFTGYDIYREVGAATAITRMYDIEVIDGALNILFESTINRPKVSAIEVFGTGSVGS